MGFPIRTSPDITPAHGSPRLFAVFHVLLRRLTPRHPPYALSSFALPDAESFIFHFTPPRQPPSFGSVARTSSLVSLYFSSLCSWKCAGRRHQAHDRGRASLPFRRCPPSAAPERIPVQRSGAKPGGLAAISYFRYRQNSPAHRRAAKKSANRSVGKKLFSSGGVSSQQVLVCPEQMKLLKGNLNN